MSDIYRTAPTGSIVNIGRRPESNKRSKMSTSDDGNFAAYAAVSPTAQVTSVVGKPVDLTERVAKPSTRSSASGNRPSRHPAMVRALAASGVENPESFNGTLSGAHPHLVANRQTSYRPNLSEIGR